MYVSIWCVYNHSFLCAHPNTTTNIVGWEGSLICDCATHHSQSAFLLEQHISTCLQVTAKTHSHFFNHSPMWWTLVGQNFATTNNAVVNVLVNISQFSPLSLQNRFPENWTAGSKGIYFYFIIECQAVFPKDNNTASHTPKMPECAHPFYFTYTVVTSLLENVATLGCCLKEAQSEVLSTELPMSPKSVLTLLSKGQKGEIIKERYLLHVWIPTTLFHSTVKAPTNVHYTFFIYFPYQAY